MTAAAAELQRKAERHDSRRSFRLRLPAVQVWGEYPFAAVTVFLALLACLITLRTELPQGALRDLQWLLVVAVVPILPWLLPLLARHLKGLRAGPLEFAFRDFDPAQITPGTAEIDDVALALSGASIAEMPTRSRDIVERVMEIEAERTEVVVINLGGDHCLLASLYFLAFLLESRTIVRRLVLEDGRGDAERVFVGMCSPRALRRSIEREHPLYKDVRKHTPIIDLAQAGDVFFRALAAETADEEADYSPSVSAGRVVQVLGPALERGWINRSELDGLPGLRRVLDSEHRYVAVVERGRSYCVLDQYRVSLEIARRATDA